MVVRPWNTLEYLQYLWLFCCSCFGFLFSLTSNNKVWKNSFSVWKILHFMIHFTISADLKSQGTPWKIISINSNTQWQNANFFLLYLKWYQYTKKPKKLQENHCDGDSFLYLCDFFFQLFNVTECVIASSTDMHLNTSGGTIYVSLVSKIFLNRRIPSPLLWE